MRSGFRIVLSLDANKNMRLGEIQRVFNNFGLLEASYLFSNQTLSATFYKDHNQIDTVWVSPNIRLISVAITLINFDIRNYRAFIIDFLAIIILGDSFVPLSWVDMRRLIIY